MIETAIRPAAKPDHAAIERVHRRALGRETEGRRVVVPGNPAWYAHFGFSASPTGRLDAPFAGAASMARELPPDSLAAGGGVRYAHAFGLASTHKESPP